MSTQIYRGFRNAYIVILGAPWVFGIVDLSIDTHISPRQVSPIRYAGESSTYTDPRTELKNIPAFEGMYISHNVHSTASAYKRNAPPPRGEGGAGCGVNEQVTVGRKDVG